MKKRRVVTQLGISLVVLIVSWVVCLILFDSVDLVVNPSYDDEYYSGWVELAACLMSLIVVAIEVVSSKIYRLNYLRQTMAQTNHDLRLLEERQASLLRQAQVLVTHVKSNSQDIVGESSLFLEKGAVETVDELRGVVLHSKALASDPSLIQVLTQLDELEALSFETKRQSHRVMSLYNQATTDVVIRWLVAATPYSVAPYGDN